MTIKYLDSKRLSGVASDTKPTNVQTNSIFIVTDTDERKWYDGTNWQPLPDRAVFAGGSSGSRETTMDYIAIGTLGNATDFGDLTVARSALAGCSNGTRGCCSGGDPDGVNGNQSNVIDYITIATTGNATDFGDLTVARIQIEGASNDTRGLFCNGYGTSTSIKNTIDYITIATTGNATDFGDSTQGTYSHAGVNNNTRACFAGGWTGSANSNVIDYVTIATTGNATDFGNLTVARINMGGNVNSSTRGVWAGGRIVSGANYNNVMDFITIATTGNATDFGDLTRTTKSTQGVSSETRGVWGGGYNGSYETTMDYITIDTLGNATDFGDLTVARSAPAGVNEK